MAATGLSEVLKDLYGYDYSQCVNFVKLLIVKQALSSSEFSYSATEDAKDRAEERYRHWVDELESVSAHSNFKDIKVSTDNFPSNEVAGKTLNDLSFDSKFHALKWLLAVTQLKFLRSTFHKESLTAQKNGDLSINIARWNLIDQEQGKVNSDFTEVLKSLNLLEGPKWPQVTPSHVAIHGCIEKFVKESLKVLRPPEKDKSYVVSYLTNPRGLFNNEESLPIILSNWFGDETLVEGITLALKSAKETQSWLKDLSDLKQHILESIGKKEWPKGKGWYYHKNDKSIYDESSKRDGRDSLQDWPTAMDMVDYYFQKNSEQYPQGSFKDVKLTSCLSTLPKIANTADTVGIWLEQFGKNLAKSTNGPIVFVSYSQPVAKMYQDILTENILSNKGLAFIPLAAEDIHLSFELIADCIAKGIYSMSSDCGILKKYEEELEKQSATSIVRVRLG